jgi:hypothetical protein
VANTKTGPVATVTPDIRASIAQMKQRKIPQKDIARVLGLSQATVSRTCTELRTRPVGLDNSLVALQAIADMPGCHCGGDCSCGRTGARDAALDVWRTRFGDPGPWDD